MRVELHPEARSEIRVAALCYEQPRAGLGDDFVHEVSRGIARIELTPNSFAVWPGTAASSVPIRKVAMEEPELLGQDVREFFRGRR